MAALGTDKELSDLLDFSAVRIFGSFIYVARMTWIMSARAAEEHRLILAALLSTCLTCYLNSASN